MGIKSPFGYCGYEPRMAMFVVTSIRDFCGGCHTNNDWDRDCKNCPMGQAIYAAKNYVIKIGFDKFNKKDAMLVKEVKNKIKRIVPRPMFLSQFIFDEKRKKDPLQALEEATKNLEFYRSTLYTRQRFTDGYENVFMTRMRKEAEKLMVKKSGK